MTRISDRVKNVIDNEKITINKFSQVLGYERSQTIHDILNSKSNPSYDFFYKFAVSEYSERYDLYWLITGKGSMLRDASGRSSELSSSDRDEVVRLLKEKIHDQQKIIDLLEEKVEALQGGIASEMDAASTSAAGWAWYHKGPPKAPK